VQVFSAVEKLGLYRHLVLCIILRLTYQKLIGTDKDNSQITSLSIGLMCQGKRIIRVLSIINQGKCSHEEVHYSGVIAVL
jgi:hypothetical protein